LLAVAEEDIRRVCAASGAPIPQFLERIHAAGATAVVLGDATWADLAKTGRLSLFDAGYAAALRALGLVDPTAEFPAPSIWARPGPDAEEVGTLLRESGVSFSSSALLGYAVFSLPEGMDIASMRTGPDPWFLAQARKAGLVPVYRIRQWDSLSAAVLRAGARRPDFPRLALVDLGAEGQVSFSGAPESRLLDEGIFLPRSVREWFDPGRWSFLEFSISAGAPAAPLRESRAHLLLARMDGSTDGAVRALRDA